MIELTSNEDGITAQPISKAICSLEAVLEIKPIYAEVESILLKEYCGVPISPEILITSFSCASSTSFFRKFSDKREEIEFLVEERTKRVCDIVSQKKIKIKPGFYKSFFQLWKKNFPLSIVTGDSNQVLEVCLKNVVPDIDYPNVNLFDMLHRCTHSSYQSQSDKVNLFLKAHSVFNTAISNTAVIADSATDVLSAREIGFPILLLSKNQRFDKDLDVKRFECPLKLSAYVLENAVY